MKTVTFMNVLEVNSTVSDNYNPSPWLDNIPNKVRKNICTYFSHPDHQVDEIAAYFVLYGKYGRLPLTQQN